MSAKREMLRCCGEEYDRDECAECAWRRECMTETLKRKLAAATGEIPRGKYEGQK